MSDGSPHGYGSMAEREEGNSLNTNSTDFDEFAQLIENEMSTGAKMTHGQLKELHLRRSQESGWADLAWTCYNVTVKSLIWLCFLFVVGWAIVRIKQNNLLKASYAYGGTKTTAPASYVGPVASVHQYSNAVPGNTAAIPPLNDGLTAAALNEYSALDLTMLPYPFLKGAILIEPYKETTILIDGMTGGCQLFWKIVNVDDPDVMFHGIEEEGIFEFKVSLTKTGKYTLKVEEECTHVHYATMTRILDQTIWVKYVRRELMSLTDEDREEFLDAFRILWEVSTKQGITKYGKNYKSLNYFAMIHNDGGANAICDEFHAGTGFLNNHVYLGMYLEQSLRMINPKVSLHYMDYSKYFGAEAFYTGHIGNTMDGGSWTEILSDKWFGKNDPYSGIISDSRWKDTKVPGMTTYNHTRTIRLSHHPLTQPPAVPYSTLQPPFHTVVTDKFLIEEGIPMEVTFFPEEQTAWLAKTGHRSSHP